MGGYGLLVNVGAGYSDATIALAEDLPGSIAAMHAASSQTHNPSADPRIKAGLAIAPCCMNRGMWDADGLSRIETPLLLMAGNSDETAGYDSGVRKIYDLAVNSDRYLLTFLNAGHNAIAPIPLPTEIHESSDQAGAFHYTDAVWDSVKSSNVMTHFATAFFDMHLKSDQGKADYLQLEPNADDGVWALEVDRPGDAHTYWLGFPNYSARGLVLNHDAPTR
jgi:predicted dienelactone hydrolase